MRSVFLLRPTPGCIHRHAVTVINRSGSTNIGTVQDAKRN